MPSGADTRRGDADAPVGRAVARVGEPTSVRCAKTGDHKGRAGDHKGRPYGAAWWNYSSQVTQTQPVMPMVKVYGKAMITMRP